MALTRILVATDHSETAQRAETFAGRLAGAGGPLEITLLYVHPELPRRSGRGSVEDVFVPGGALSERDRGEMHELLMQASRRIRDAAGTNDVRITELLLGASDIGGAIVHEAARAGVEAIVMGSRGRSDVASLMLGSTSHKVLHLAHCPVIVVR